MPRHLIGEQGMPPGLLSAVNNHLRTGAGKGRDGERERRRGRGREGDSQEGVDGCDTELHMRNGYHI